MDGCPLGLGLVVEDKPTEFSHVYTYTLYLFVMVYIFIKDFIIDNIDYVTGIGKSSREP